MLQPPTNRREYSREERFEIALKMRMDGCEYKEIARKFDVSGPRACQIVQAAYQRLHTQCPSCGSRKVLRSMEWRGVPDTNVAQCDDCGWRGTVDDLVAKISTGQQAQ